MAKNHFGHALLCLALLVWHANAAPVTIRSNKPGAQGGIMPSKGFINDMCRLMTDNIQFVPWPLRIDGICDNLGLSNPENGAGICPMFDLMKMLLGNLQGLYPMQCSPDTIAPPSSVDPSDKGFLLPSPLPSQMKEGRLPSRFQDDEASGLLQAEGPTHYWLYKHITRLMAWAPCNAMGVEGNWAHPEGWDLLAMLGAREDLSAYGIASTSMPFAAVLRRSSNAQTRASCKAFVAAHPSMASASASSASSPRASARAARELCWGDELVVLVRGTASAFDWFYNLDYSMATNPYYGKGAMHLGFLRLAGGLWLGGLRDVMKQYGGTVSSVTIAGHSLGAATAALLASRTQNWFAANPTRHSVRSAPQVTAVLFGSPNVGDPTFVADYNSRVNTRNIGFFTDMVTQMPCVGSMVQCTGGAEAAGSDPAAPGSKGGNVTVKYMSYDRLGGSIDLHPGRTTAGSRGSVMPTQTEAWSLLNVYTQDDFCSNMMSMGNLVEATHICSYMCALSNTSPETAGDWCLLWNGQGSEAAAQQSGATYCMSGFSFISESGDFPANPAFPSRKDNQWLQQQPMRKGPQNKAERVDATAGGDR